MELQPKDVVMKIKVVDGVRLPEPQYVDKVAVCWNLYPRAVVVEALNQNTGLYKDIFDFKPQDFSEVVGGKIRSRPDPKGGMMYLLRQGETVAIGLGISLDFGQNFWYHGLISMRKVGLFRGLEVVNANNPIFAETKGEVVAFIKNNSDAQYISRNEALLQIHFSESLRIPNVETVSTVNFL